jgi:hypothetical protein
MQGKKPVFYFFRIKFQGIFPFKKGFFPELIIVIFASAEQII